MDLSNLAAQANLLVTLSKFNFYYLLWFMVFLWGFNLINWWVLNSALNVFGIYPRHLIGLPGIFFSPFLHGDFNHLFFNSIPLIALANFVLIGGLTLFIDVTLFIVIGSGILVWLFGRRGIHIGASSLIMGYFGYLLANTYFFQSGMSLIIGIITVYYFGGLVLGLFPTQEKVSWEGHLLGFITGVVASCYFAGVFQGFRL
jgi:membrane associated rhomboid family serine protease